MEVDLLKTRWCDECERLGALKELRGLMEQVRKEGGDYSRIWDRIVILSAKEYVHVCGKGARYAEASAL